ncbi:hypothetical protein [Pararhizobium antarcticum]|uniref:Glycosyltransferase RgtA/B/C/D-like domain-containing protein n=1 Tax=Pararhizobium antarcticum TaxID=1798805 RepID=A0A657LWL6_9HYPH|nr:hypothetical protein [Pararhizobium antarcticum]OJF91085.1 hypothetical protein AX761_06405 [Rhizobium sp. 58]OJG00015.1 hypothetical protein AX760_11580 [Pararhizobium antarcticum]
MQAFTKTDPKEHDPRATTRLAARPLLLLALTIALVVACLLVTIPMPIGPMYWDHYIYLDAANRIFDGQMPSVDFFTPAGGLGYYLFAMLLELFPNGHPLLLASWSLLVVTAPLMAIVLSDVQKRSTRTALALLLPFLLFSVLPFNTGDFYPYPGSDGFGIYNRQVCQVLYVLACGLLHVKDQRKLVAIVALSMLSLLFIKVTGVVAGVILCAMAFAAGRLGLRAAILAGLVFFATIAVLEGTTGMVTAYAADILALLAVNNTSLIPRLVQAASLNFGIVLASSVLCIILFWQRFTDTRQTTNALLHQRSLAILRKTIDQPAFWMVAFLAAGLLFESQNTGSQAFIFLWPLLLAILVESHARDGRSSRFLVVAAFALAIAAPPAVLIMQKSTRAWLGMANGEVLESTNIKTMGAVNIRSLQLLRAERMQQNYSEHKNTYEALALAGELPSFLLYSEYDFQTLWLRSADAAITALHDYEAANRVRFETIMTIDFTNPFPWLMDRHAPKYIAIGADPYRAVPEPDERVAAAVKATDIALYPTCPPTTARFKLLSLYEPLLMETHTRITLTPCFDGFIRKDLPTTP